MKTMTKIRIELFSESQSQPRVKRMSPRMNPRMSPRMSPRMPTICIATARRKRSDKMLIIVAVTSTVLAFLALLRMEGTLFFFASKGEDCIFGCPHQQLQAARGSCSFLGGGDLSLSLDTFLQTLRPKILKRTMNHFFDQVYHDDHHANNATTRATLEEIMNLYDDGLIRRGMVNPMPLYSSEKIVQIIHKRLKDPNKNPPLHIMVFGGSIVAGQQGSRYTTNDARRHIYRGNETAARWSTQLEILLNDVMFDRRNVVRVTNMAVGMTSDVASILLKNKIWPEGYPAQGPDLVIASFGFTDVNKFVSEDNNNNNNNNNNNKGYEDLFSASQKFTRAALSLGRCDNLPGIMFVDDSFLMDHLTVRDNLVHSRALLELATWYDVMVVSYTKAFLHYSYSDMRLQNLPQTHKKQRDILDDATVTPLWPLFGGVLPTYYYPQLFYHSGIAWLIVFELLQTFLDVCEYEEAAGAENTALANTRQFHELNPRQIPELKEQYFQEVPLPWIDSTTKYEASCADKNYQPGNNACSYLWIASKVTGVRNGEDVKQTLETVEIANDGWVGEGFPARPPRPGYVATKANASFTIDVPVTKNLIRKVTILYIKSSGEKWNSSRCRVTLRSMRGASVLSETQRELEGFHDSETSVIYDAYFDVAADVGDHVEAKFDVIGGNAFKITGMLFCTR